MVYPRRFALSFEYLPVMRYTLAGLFCRLTASLNLTASLRAYEAPSAQKLVTRNIRRFYLLERVAERSTPGLSMHSMSRDSATDEAYYVTSSSSPYTRRHLSSGPCLW